MKWSDWIAFDDLKVISQHLSSCLGALAAFYVVEKVFEAAIPEKSFVMRYLQGLEQVVLLGLLILYGLQFSWVHCSGRTGSGERAHKMDRLVMSWFSDTWRMFVRYTAVGLAFAVAGTFVSVLFYALGSDNGTGPFTIGCSVVAGLVLAVYAWKKVGSMLRVRKMFLATPTNGCLDVTATAHEPRMASSAAVAFVSVCLVSSFVGRSSASFGGSSQANQAKGDILVYRF